MTQGRDAVSHLAKRLAGLLRINKEAHAQALAFDIFAVLQQLRPACLIDVAADLHGLATALQDHASLVLITDREQLQIFVAHRERLQEVLQPVAAGLPIESEARWLLEVGCNPACPLVSPPDLLSLARACTEISGASPARLSAVPFPSFASSCLQTSYPTPLKTLAGSILSALPSASSILTVDQPADVSWVRLLFFLPLSSLICSAIRT